MSQATELGLALVALLRELHDAGVEQIPRCRSATPPQSTRARTAHDAPSRTVTEAAAKLVAPPAAPEVRPAVGPAAAASKSTHRVLFAMDEPTAAAREPQEEKSAAPTLEILAEEVAACTRCEELASTRTQTVFADGNPRSRLVFLGEAPGADEDAQGKPFVGRAGKLLTDIIERGMKLRRSDVYIMNVLKCRPPGNRTPLPHEANNCRPFLLRQIELVEPEFICCLGAVAAQNLLQTTQSIGKMRGRLYDWRGIQVMCTYHPAYLLRSPAAKHQTWEDIQMLMRAMGIG